MHLVKKLMFRRCGLLPLVAVLLLLCPQSVAGQQSSRREQRDKVLAERRLAEADAYFAPWRHMGRMGIDSVNVQRHNQLIQVYLHPNVTHMPIREAWIQAFEVYLYGQLGRRFRQWSIELISRDRSLIEFIPNLHRSALFAPDTTRVRNRPPVNPLVRNLSRENIPAGLLNHHIALWHSHGYYYSGTKDRWQWQRARLFGTVEDIFPLEYVLHYIVPMLENAGAQVLIPRERDTQRHEVIVDNGRSSGASLLVEDAGEIGWTPRPGGFALPDTLFDGDNPFLAGSHQSTPAGSGARLQYIPHIPEDGYYAVYFSWAQHPRAIDKVPIEVHYAGGKAAFELNQQMGWGTWVYLGHFFFRAGSHPDSGSLVIESTVNADGVITADAARFGGGMGNVARSAQQRTLPNRQSATDGGTTTPELLDDKIVAPTSSARLSQVPRFMEGARYYLQYAGMPDTLVYNPNLGLNDYNDDFMARGEWVNYLMGAPLGPEKCRTAGGLNIPVDLSLAFHTDAGITTTDSVIGTLAIFSTLRDNGIFPDGVSRMASRDLTDLVQEQIIADIRALHNPQWTQRALWDRQYSEAWRPNVPAMLLELLSHQNLADMQYGLDPRFQFTVSRAIYKGVLRYLAHNHGREAVVQPLPPAGMRIESPGGKKVRISWQATPDPLEPSAEPDFFKLYMRTGTGGFDTGQRFDQNFAEIELPHYDTLYSFRVTALNRGGESFPSEILAASFNEDHPRPFLVVNGFTRISGPQTFDTGTLAGISWWDPLPVPYQYSYSYTGLQYDYNRQSPWLDDDSPGWGASYADREGQKLVGNTFDNAAIHGDAIRMAGRSFVSTSREAFEQEDFNPEPYPMISLVLGKQLGVPAVDPSGSIEFRIFTPAMIRQLQRYTQSGGNLFLSGAYVGTDMMVHNDEVARAFAAETLGFSWRTNNACNSGTLLSTGHAHHWMPDTLLYNTLLDDRHYPVPAPDAIEPATKGSYILYRFASNQTGAAVYFPHTWKVLTLGFPFESMPDKPMRNLFMQNIIQLFETNITH